MTTDPTTADTIKIAVTTPDGDRCALIDNHVGPHTTQDTAGRIIASWRNEADA